MALLTWPARARARLATHAGLTWTLLWLLVALDGAVGVNWLLIGPAAKAPAYVAATTVMPMQAWGALFLAWAVAGLVLATRSTRQVRAFAVRNVGAALWLFWLVLFTWAAIQQPLVSGLGAIVAATFLTLHRIVGHALATAEDPQCGNV